MSHLPAQFASPGPQRPLSRVSAGEACLLQVSSELWIGSDGPGNEGRGSDAGLVEGFFSTEQAKKKGMMGFWLAAAGVLPAVPAFCNRTPAAGFPIPVCIFFCSIQPSRPNGASVMCPVLCWFQPLRVCAGHRVLLFSRRKRQHHCFIPRWGIDGPSGSKTMLLCKTRISGLAPQS